MSEMVIPIFTTEGEEADWWYDNRDSLSANFSKAIKEGKVTRGSLATRLAAMRGETIVRVPKDDSLLAARLAAQDGLDVDKYLTDLLHRALQSKVESAA